LLVFLGPSVPAFHILVGTFSVLQGQKVEKDGCIPSFRVGILTPQRAKDEEFLRGRVWDGGQDDRTERDTEV